MFDVKTPKRTYYLAADSETDMNKWVDCVCQVCGLKSATDDNCKNFYIITQILKIRFSNLIFMEGLRNGKIIIPFVGINF